jgi:hypothetical protein
VEKLYLNKYLNIIKYRGIKWDLLNAQNIKMQ